MKYELNLQTLMSRENELRTQLGILEIERKHIRINEQKLNFYFLSLVAISLMVIAILPLFGYSMKIDNVINVAFSMLSLIFGYMAMQSSKRLLVDREKIKRIEILEFEIRQLLDETKEVLNQVKSYDR